MYIGMTFALCLCQLQEESFGQIPLRTLHSIKIFGCAGLMWIFGLMDDVSQVRGPTLARGLSFLLSSRGPWVRLAFQGIFTGACVLGLHLVLPMPEMLGIFAMPVTLIALIGFINFSNFSDGINGLWGGTSLIWMLWMHFLFPEEPLFILGSGAVLGYFLLNFPKGRLFMGDSGSTFLGALMVCSGLFYAQKDSSFLQTFNFFWMNSTSSPHMFLADYYLFLLKIFSPLAFVFSDVLMTLLRRILSGHHPFEAHREHTMQRLVHILGVSHGTTAIIYMAGSLLSMYLLGGIGSFFWKGSETTGILMGIFGFMLFKTIFVTTVEFYIRKKGAR